MFNILLDDLPEKWNGYEINTDLAIGIQLSQCLTDEDLSDEEKLYTAVFLLFKYDFPRDYGQITEAIMWLLNGWNNFHMLEHVHRLIFLSLARVSLIQRKKSRKSTGSGR